jgi:hypothetical protein
MAKRTIPKVKKGAWFVKLRSSYIPATWQGWATYIPFLAVTITGMQLIWMRDESLADLLIFGLPFLVATGVVMTWFAARKA